MSVRIKWKRAVSAVLLLLIVSAGAWTYGHRSVSGPEKALPQSTAPADTAPSRPLPVSSGQPSSGSITARAQSPSTSPRSGLLRDAKLGQLEPLPGNLAQQIPDLERRAKAGDAKAAVDLWYGLDRCKNVLSENETQYIKSGVAPNPEAYAKVQQETLDSCEGVTAEQIAHRYDWLKQPAAKGDPQAQFFYAIAGSAVFGSPNEALRDPQAWADYKETAMSYLHGLAQRCDPSAISFFWWGYGQGNQYLSIDRAKALYYKQITVLMSPSENTPAILAAAKAGLPQEVIESQSQAAGQFYQSHCQ